VGLQAEVLPSDAIDSPMNEAAPPVPVELASGGEVVLHVSSDRLGDIAPLVQALLAEGFDTAIAADADAFAASIVERPTPVLHVVCHRDGELDLQQMRARARELSDVEHVWLDGGFGSDAPLCLVGPITRVLTDMEWPEPDRVAERVDVDEISNVVLLPVVRAAPTTPAPEAPRAAKWRPHLAALIAGVLAAASVALAVGEEEAAILAPALASELKLPKPRVRTLDLRHVPAAHVVLAEPVDPPAPLEPDPLQDLVTSGKARAAAGVVVSPPLDPGTDWHRAMTTCRARRFFGISGWTLPTRQQLVALARARALPDALLWSRNKADREGQQAFAVGGRSGLSRATPKPDLDIAIVCVKRWPEE
jgi:hypothetical protein